jgi:A/G-specific adenine glycosylase
LPNPIVFRRRLLRWYRENARKLPWRSDATPWRILVSEIMLQQTRVEAMLPYYQRFLQRFPDAASFAAASEPEVLAIWSGLGYYARARNLQRAASLIAGGFPSDYDAIRALPGVGPYTAAAVASIGFGLPHAAVDGNVLRVLARFTGDGGDITAGATRARLTAVAEELLDRANPGDFNQALMELGAAVCVPKNPRCLVCPVAEDCVARQQGRQIELPVKTPKAGAQGIGCAVVIVRRRARLLLKQRPADAPRMAGFWELPDPEDVPDLPILRQAGEFQHTIVNTRYQVRVLLAAPTRDAHSALGTRWFSKDELAQTPLTTITRKALRHIS